MTKGRERERTDEVLIVPIDSEIGKRVGGNPSPGVLPLQDVQRRRRSEHGSLITIFDDHAMIRLTLIRDTKTALLNPPTKEEVNLPKHSQQDWIETLSKLSDKPDKELGEKMLDGRNEVGFEASHGGTKFALWLDAKSKQLVRIEMDNPLKGAWTKTAMTELPLRRAAR